MFNASPLGFNLHDISYEALDYLRAMAAENDGVVNTFTQPAAVALGNLPPGIQFFDFDTVGRDIEIEVTPLTNRLPRRGPVGGVAMFWREITAVNSGKTRLNVAEGLRGGTISMATRDRMCKYAGLGLENANTFESMYAARGVANPRELARLQTLKAVRMGEELINLYGNGGSLGVALGTPDAPVGVAAATGVGETADSTARTIKCVVVALTGEGLELSSVASGVVGTITRNNADGSISTFGGGSSLPSAASADVVVAANEKITHTVADVPGALGYAWYTGVSGGTYRLAKITTINQFIQYTDEGGAAQASTAITADNSINEYTYNGVMTILQDSGSGAYYQSLDGAGWTADSTGNIMELIEAFLYFYENYLISPTEVRVGPIEAYEITKTLLSGSAAAIYAKNLAKSDAVEGGFYVSSLLNPFTGNSVKLTLQPNMPAGYAVLMTWSVPYPIQNLGNIWEVLMRQPYYVIDWPLRTRKNEVGVYVDQGIKCEFPIAQGIIKNVKSTSLRAHNSLLMA